MTEAARGNSPGAAGQLDQIYEYRARLLTRLAEQPAEFAELVALIPNAEWHNHRAPDGATLHQLAAHFRDAEGLAFWPRVQRILVEDFPHLDPFPHHRWSVEAQYRADEPVAAILASFTLTRADVVERLRPLDPDTWTRAGFHPPSGPRTLQFWVERLYTHARDHLAEIRRLAATHPAWTAWLP